MIPDSPQIKHINKINCAKRSVHWRIPQLSLKVPAHQGGNSSAYVCGLVSFTLIYKTYNSIIPGNDTEVFALINKIRTFKYWEPGF